MALMSYLLTISLDNIKKKKRKNTFLSFEEDRRIKQDGIDYHYTDTN